MDEAVIRKNLGDLVETITTLPLTAAQRTAGGVYTSDARPEMTTQESLDQLRLQIKYLVFDLEATRRENRYLRQLLENRPHPGKGADDVHEF